jgi:hypothetical protein
MAKITITCEGCTAPYLTSRKNTKYCPTCRLITDLKFIANTVRKCWLCKAPFAPIAFKDPACGECAYHPTRPGSGPCAYCQTEGRYAVAGVLVCNTCIRNPKLREKLIKALTLKQRARREQFADPEARITEIQRQQDLLPKAVATPSPDDDYCPAI